MRTKPLYWLKRMLEMARRKVDNDAIIYYSLLIEKAQAKEKRLTKKGTFRKHKYHRK